MGTEPPPSDRNDYDRADDEDEGWFPYTAPTVGLPLWPAWDTDEPETYPEDETGYADDEYETGFEGDEEGTLLDEGLITLLLVGGVVLFVIPEPATSTIGIGLIILGAIAWIFDLLTPGT